MRRVATWTLELTQQMPAFVCRLFFLFWIAVDLVGEAIVKLLNHKESYRVTFPSAYGRFVALSTSNH